MLAWLYTNIVLPHRNTKGDQLRDMLQWIIVGGIIFSNFVSLLFAVIHQRRIDRLGKIKATKHPVFYPVLAYSTASFAYWTAMYSILPWMETDHWISPTCAVRFATEGPRPQSAASLASGTWFISITGSGERESLASVLHDLLWIWHINIATLCVTWVIDWVDRRVELAAQEREGAAADESCAACGGSGKVSGGVKSKLVA